MATDEIFQRRSRLAHPADEVFDWHLRPGALERLTPPWSGVTVVSRSGSVRDEGATVVLRMPVGPFGLHWVATHRDFVAGRSFRDEQTSGPFAHWSHTHTVEPDGDGCILDDTIAYRLPLAPLSTAVAAPAVRAMLEQTFAWRHRRTQADLDAHRRAGLEPLRVAISGANGLVGSQLAAFLSTGGHDVRGLVRRPREAGDLAWDPASGHIDRDGLDGLDAVVHLAGESIATSRWSPAAKQRILESRTAGTALLARTLAGLPRKPRVLVCASAIGFYGDRGDAALDDDAERGEGFLADVCRQWEEAAAPARDAGIRVVHLRLGVVMTPLGGALAQMLPAFRLGAGGTLGSGTQFLSWISLDDVLGAVLHAMATPSLDGPVNATAPAPVTNADFTRTLASVLHRPAVLPVPAFALRALLGEMADALLLSSARVLPTRLLGSGFVFRDADLGAALADMLGRGRVENAG